MKTPIFSLLTCIKVGTCPIGIIEVILDIFHSMIMFVKPPDLLIYLKAGIPKLVRQIEKRGRDFEYSIRLDYLRQLNKHYESWIGNYKDGKLLIIDVDHLDFVENIDDFSFIVNKVDLEINNLFG